MDQRHVCLVASMVAATLLFSGCTQAAPPTPTSAPAKAAEPTKPAAAPAKSAEPTKAAAPAQPTQAPAKKADFPQKGKAITLINPWPAGGGSDIAARILASLLEKDLGTAVEVVNKPGAAGQLGATELVRAKPDGYTLCYAVNPDVIAVYLNPDRKAIFTRKDFSFVALQAFDPLVMAVKEGSPYKSLKDVVDAAKANPEKVKVSTFGILSGPHLQLLQLQQLSGAKFAAVHFDGAAPSVTALLGGHVDVSLGYAGAFVPQMKTGGIRAIAIMDKEENKFFPGVKTAEAQGFKLFMSKASGIVAPAGTPPEVVDLLSKAIKKAMDTDEHKKKMDDAGQTLRYMDPKQYATYWEELETTLKPLVEEGRTAQK